LYSGAFPEHVKKLILIEGLGPLSQSDKNAAKCMRKAIEAEKKAFFKVASSSTGESTKDHYDSNNNNISIMSGSDNYTIYDKKKNTRLYSNFGAAVQARINSVLTYPGKQTLSLEAAIALVER